MKKILSILFATMLAGQAFAKENFDFSAICNSGQTLYYKITSSIEPYTVAVTYPNTGQSLSLEYNYSGYGRPNGIMVIPETVTCGDVKYTVTSIGWFAFYNCYDLTSVIIPESVTYIAENAFCDCRGLTSVKIPNSVTTIGDNAFGGCSNLSTLVIPKSITTIGNQAFYQCKSLSKIVIPNSVTTIGDEAFERCSSLRIITIPKSVVSIGTKAFYETTNLNVLLEVGVLIDGYEVGWTKTGDKTFLTPKQNSCVYQNDIVFFIGDNNNVSLYRYSGNNTAVAIPEKITVSGIEYTVTYIYDNAFENVNYIIDYTGITDGRPWGANKIYAAIDEYGLIYADTERTRLVVYVGDGKVITIPNTVTSIEDGAFSNCNHLTSITIPETVKYIGDSVFGNCENIDYSNYKGCRYIGNNNNPFYALFAVNSTDMSKFELNSNCKIICGGAFRNCDKPTSITIPESVVSICNNAFDGCSGLVDISIPNSVTYIEKSAFANCSNIAKLTFNTNAINDCFSGNIQLTEINIGNSVTNIAKSAFSGCNGLTSISIPNSVVSIDTNAFSGCNNLTSIMLPSKVASIGYNAFNCSELKQVICLMETPATLVADPFPNTDSIFVPNASVDIYSAAPFWRRKIILPLVSAESVNATQGSVSIEDDTNSDNTVIISATSAEHYHFVSWSDGNTDNPRTLTANVFTQLTALFEADENTVVVSANSATFGSVTGSGLYHYGDTATFTATPSKGYHFVKWNDDNTDNPRSYIVTNDVSIAAIFAGHTIVTDAAVAATCITTGLSEGSHCSVCGEIIVEQTVTPKAEHTAVVDAAVAATCTATGLTEGSHCSVCGKVIVAQKTIPIGKHTSVTDPAVAATTTSTGLTEGSHCSVCGKVIVAQTVIPMLDNGGENQGGNENQGGDNEGNENQGESNEGNGNQGGNNEGNENQGNENTNPSTAVAESAADNLQVYAHHNTIIVENATDEIRVYNAMGALVGRDVACRVRAEINVNGTGVYIVKVGSVAKRVMVY